MLHLLAVAGYPVEWETLRRAARIDPSGADPFAPLRTARARIRGVPGRRILEPYHDRVRESVASSLGPEDTRTCHLSLAAAIEASSRPDPQALAFHYGEAGLMARAARYAAQAGAEAEAALAFERAAASMSAPSTCGSRGIRNSPPCAWPWRKPSASPARAPRPRRSSLRPPPHRARRTRRPAGCATRRKSC